MRVLSVKIALISIFLIFNIKSYGQFQSVSIGIDGLTCSMCSNNVEKLLRQLSFIENIEMNLNDHIAKITFVPNEKVEIYKIAQKVIDAGYSLRFLKANYDFNLSIPSSTTNFQYMEDTYIITNPKESVLSGSKEIQFLGKKYLSKKEFQKWSSLIPEIKSKNKTNTYYIAL